MRAAVLVGTGVTKVVPASAEKASAVVAELPKAEADAPPVPEGPAATADGQQGSAARPKGRKSGRPGKAESEGEDGGQAWEKAEVAV
jgi:hypothetical protein